MKVYKKIMDGLATVEKLALSIVLVITTVITFVNAILRKLSEIEGLGIKQFAWTEELVINLFVLMIMLGCALCAKEGSLISLSLIFDRLKLRGQKVFVVIITIVNTVFWVFLLTTGWEKVMVQLANGKRTFSLGWPEWVFTIFLPIGAVLLILHTIEFFIDFMSQGKNNQIEEASAE